MKALRVPWDLQTHTALWPEGTVFSIELYGRKRVKLRAKVTMNGDGTLTTMDADAPVEFGRPGRFGVKTGIRIFLDRADPTDLLVARRFLDDCLALYETARPKREEHRKDEVPIRDERSGRYA